MTTFYIVRHGETEWNKENRLQGWLNSPLTTFGREQADRLHDALLDIDFEAAYVSTSGRAIETANRVLAGRSVEMVLQEDLREISLGEWQGKTVKEILASSDATSYVTYSENPENYVAVHTESFEDVAKRAIRVLESVAKCHDGHVLIITHAVTVISVVNTLLGRGVSEIWSPPWIEGTSVTVLSIEEGEWQIKKIGCTAHLV